MMLATHGRHGRQNAHPRTRESNLATNPELSRSKGDDQLNVATEASGCAKIGWLPARAFATLARVTIKLFTTERRLRYTLAEPYPWL
jgi:hypothetical protein